MLPKIVIIGLDGACWKYIDPWLDAGELPNLKELIKNGSRGVLRSSIPPVSSVAWPSIYTGTNPGKHGIFDWQWISTDKKDLIFASGSEVQSIAFWTIVNEYGKKVGIINVPMTYPPEEIDGFFISGMDSPRNAQNISNIDIILKKLDRECGKYTILPKGDLIFEKRMDEYVKLWEEIENIRTCYAVKILQKLSVDIFFIVYQITDIINHFTNDTSLLLSAYKIADRNIGKIIKSFANEETTFFVISDHGAKAVKKEFYLNVWLERKGLLRYKKNPYLVGEDAHSAIRNCLKSVSVDYPSIIKKIVRNVLVKLLSRRNMLSMLFWKYLSRLYPNIRKRFSNIDWDNTQFYTTAKYGCIYLNRNCKKTKVDYDRLIEHLVLELQKMKIPGLNKTVFQSIIKGNEFYKGKFDNNAPDIIAVSSDEDIMVSNAFISKNNILFGEPNTKLVGDHSMDGIILASGNHVKKGKVITNATVFDVVPTVLYLMNIPIPSYLDGKILEEFIVEQYKNKNHIRYVDRDYEKKKFETKTSEQDKDEIRKWLSQLGYIG